MLPEQPDLPLSATNGETPTIQPAGVDGTRTKAPALPRRVLLKKTIVMTYAILIGIAPMIPLPLLDEILISFFQRRLVIDLSRLYGLKLSQPEVKALAGQRGLGCAEGCLSALIYPFKEILRELLFWREVGRGINLATHTYYSAILLDEVFQQGWYQPEKVLALADAIQRATARVNTRLVRDAFAKTFASSRGVVLSTMRWLFKFDLFIIKKTIGSVFGWVRSLIRPVDRMARHFDLDQYFVTVQPDLSALVQELVDHLDQGINSIPDDHFNHLRSNLYSELKLAGIGG